jgi:hypothetical protein
MPSISKKRRTLAKKELGEVLSSHEVIKMAGDIRRLIDGGMSRPGAEKKVISELFKKRQK